MNTDEIIEELKRRNDRELINVIEQVLAARTFEYDEASDEYDWPTDTAKLAVTRKIFCS